nr:MULTISPECIES: universal stress protein [unclassified Caballeronia]
MLCYDATAVGRRTLRLGAHLARDLHGETHLLAVVDDTEWTRGVPVIPAVSFELQERTAKDLLHEGVDELADLGVVAQRHLAVGNPMMEISAFAKALDIDLIVIGHHRSGRFYRWWTGQDESRLLDQVSCSVLVIMEPQELKTH